MSIAVNIGQPAAIASRDDLVREVKAELNRDDLTELEVRAFIQRAEARLNRLLRHPAMETLATATFTDGAANLPADFLELRSVTDANGTDLSAYEPTAFMGSIASGYALIGGKLHAKPSTVTAASILYYAAIPELSADAPSNWVLARHPDLYFYATCLAADSRIGNDDRLGTWKAAFDECLAEVQLDGVRRRYGGRLQMRVGSLSVAGVRA